MSTGNAEMLEKMQEIAFMMIAEVGTAKSMFIEAVQLAKKGDFEGAKNLMKEGTTIYSKAHGYHFDLVQKESEGEELPFSIIFMHAEDQMLNTETVKIMAEELIEVHTKLSK